MSTEYITDELKAALLKRLLLPTSMKFESNIKKKAGNHQPQKKEIYKVFFINTAYTLTLIQRHH
jgi:hypothetical protein